jgi:hypothetical protein
MVYPRTAHTDQPAVVIAERGASRLVYFPGDIDRSYWRSQNMDLERLLINSLRWVLRDAPVSVTGDGMAEVFAWKTKPGFAIHVLNYTNPDMLRGWFNNVYPLGPQRVRVTLPSGVGVSKVHLLAAGRDISSKRTGQTLEFTIPDVRDYEVAAVV